MKYLKVWMGVTSGSYLGRNDGYPERKFSVIENLDDLVRGFDDNAEYYILEKVDLTEAIRALKELEQQESK